MSEKKAFVLRVNPETLKELQKWADDEFRSLNGQIEYLLQRALVDNGKTKSRLPSGKKAEIKKKD